VRLKIIVAMAAQLLLLTCEPVWSHPVSVKDVRGKTIVVRSTPRRIVSLAPNNTEILFALGLANRVVGVTSWCDYPPAARKKPRVGDRAINVEKVIALKPDLIVAHAKLNDAYIGRLESIGKTVIAIDPKTYKEVMSDILIIGRATGRDARATQVVRQMRSSLQKVRRRPLDTRRNVLVVIQPSPLWAAGPKTLVDEMLGFVRAVNIAHDSQPGFNQFPVEKAIARRPDVLIVGKGEKRFFLDSPIWRDTKAVRDNRVYDMDFDLLVRPGPRLAEGLTKLAAVLR